MKTNKSSSRTCQAWMSFTIVVVLISNTLISNTSTNLSADDGQAFWRFLGHGWSHGYHAYPPRCTHAQQVPEWIHRRPGCTDRYSLPNSGGCFNYGQGCQLNRNNTIQQVPYPIGSSQPPALHQPIVSSHQMNHSDGVRPSMGRTVNSDSATPQGNAYDPGPSVSPSKSNPTNSFQLPPVDSSESELVQPPSDSGTSTNPFGVSINYISPQPSIMQQRPMNPFQTRIAYQIPKRKIQQVSPLRNRNQGTQTNRRQIQKRQIPNPEGSGIPGSNTYQGIR